MQACLGKVSGAKGTDTQYFGKVKMFVLKMKLKQSSTWARDKWYIDSEEQLGGFGWQT